MSERLTRGGFDRQLETGKLTLSLIGMSNVGKSHWRNKLQQEADFDGVSCDDLIEANLGEELKNKGFSGGLQDVARWMGQPYDPQFPRTQQRYLELEADAVDTAVANAKNSGNYVIDTTGSVVHLPQHYRRDLRSASTVVYLEASEEVWDTMYQSFISNPKPVVWGDQFTQRNDETHADALARSYPDLLQFRHRYYREMAHAVLPYEVSRGASDAPAFLKHVRDSLTD